MTLNDRMRAPHCAIDNLKSDVDDNVNGLLLSKYFLTNKINKNNEYAI